MSDSGLCGSRTAVLDSGPVLACVQECKKLLEEKFKTGKNRWFFSKLRF